MFLWLRVHAPAATLHNVKYFTWLQCQHVVSNHSAFGFTSGVSPHKVVGFAIDLASNVFSTRPADKLTSISLPAARSCGHVLLGSAYSTNSQLGSMGK